MEYGRLQLSLGWPEGGILIKVLQTLPYLESAGTERHVLALSQALLAEHEVRLLSPEGPLLDLFKQSGVEHTAFPPFQGIPGPSLRGIKTGIDQALEWGVDVIHVHAGVEVLYGVHRALKSLQKSPPQVKRPAIIFTVHSYFGKWPNLDYALAAKLNNRWADRVIAVSHADAATLSRYGLPLGKKLFVVHNGMPDHTAPSGQAGKALRQSLETRYGLETETPICLVVGRLAEQKGIDVLLEALQRYDGPATLVLVAGGGDLRDALEAQAKTLGVHEDSSPLQNGKPLVVFLGPRSDVPDLLSVANLFVLPSRMEGLSLALVEAHAAALPCLVTDVGGNSEIVSHGHTGTVVPSEDPSALALALADMLKDKDRLGEFGIASRRRYEEHFTLEAMVRDTLNVYQGALDGGRST